MKVLRSKSRLKSKKTSRMARNLFAKFTLKSGRRDAALLRFRVAGVATGASAAAAAASAPPAAQFRRTENAGAVRRRRSDAGAGVRRRIHEAGRLRVVDNEFWTQFRRRPSLVVHLFHRITILASNR